MFLQSQIASIELVPYHSKRFSFPAKLVPSLKSTDLAKKYVHEVLLPAALRGERLVVATRARDLRRVTKVAQERRCLRGAGNSKWSLVARESRGAARYCAFLRSGIAIVLPLGGRPVARVQFETAFSGNGE